MRSWHRTRVRGCPPVSAHPRRLLSSWLSPNRSPLSGCSSGTATLAPAARADSGAAPHHERTTWYDEEREQAWCRNWNRRTIGTGLRVSERMTSLLFLLGEGRHRQPRAVYKYWAPCRLLQCRDHLHREQLSLVLPSTWHTARVGSDHYGTAHTGLCLYAHFRAIWTTFNSLSVSLVVMVSQMS